MIWHLTNLERTRTPRTASPCPATTSTSAWSRAKTQTIEFVADMSGTFTYYCTEFCSALHLEMLGYFLVEP